MGAKADDRHRLLGQRGEDQLALLALGQHAAGFGIDDLGQEMILPDRRAVLGLGAFLADAGADHLRQAVAIDGDQAEAALDLRPHALAPRLRPADRDAQAAVAGAHPLALDLVGDRQQVGGRRRDDVRAEVGDQPGLALGEAAGDRDDGAAQRLGAVVEAEAAGEQAVAIGVVQLVGRPAAGGADRARHDRRPHRDVGPAVAHHRRPAGRAARRMDAHDLVHRHGEHAEGIVLPEILLGREGQPGKVVEAGQVAGSEAGGGERPAVMRHPLIGVRQRPPEPPELECRELVAARGLDRLQRFHRRQADQVGVSTWMTRLEIMSLTLAP